MGRAIQLKGQMRCSICGKPDYCYRLPLAKNLPAGYSGEDFYSVCNRGENLNISGVGDTFIGASGIEYYCDKVYEPTASSNVLAFGYRCIPKELREAWTREWREEHGFRKGEWVPKNPKAAPRRIEKPVEEPEEKEFIRPTEELDSIYRYFLSLLVLEEEDVRYLASEGIPEILQKHYMLRSIPEDDGYRIRHKDTYITANDWRVNVGEKVAREFRGNLSGVPGFRKNKTGKWTYSGYGGIIFPLKNALGHIYRLRVRVTNRYRDLNGEFLQKGEWKRRHEEDDTSVPREIGKYLNFSSSGDTGTHAGCNFGIYLPKKRKVPYDTTRVWITEGEKKSIVGCEYLQNAFIDVPGVGVFGILSRKEDGGKSLLDFMWERGVQDIVVAYDADKATNQMVLNAEKGLTKMLGDMGFRVYIADWDVNVGKGLDDLLLKGVAPTITRIV